MAGPTLTEVQEAYARTRQRPFGRFVGLLAVALLVAGLVVAVSPPANAAPSWKAADLDPTGLTGQSWALAINDAGDAVGHARLIGQPGWRATLWDAAGGMTDLGTLGGVLSQAFGINDTRHVVGQSQLSATSGVSHAFVWDEADGLTDLGVLGDPERPELLSSHASAINDDGVIVGSSYTSLDPCCQTRAFVWQEGVGMTDLGTLGGSDSAAIDINDEGQVVGWADTASGPRHAFLWTEADGMTDLGTLGGVTSEATGINDDGQVVGRADKASGGSLFLWDPAGGMTDIGFPGASRYYWWTDRVTDVNSLGQVPYGTQVWDADHGWRPLPSPTTGPVAIAAGINDAGQIAGASEVAGQKDRGTNVVHATRWNPPAPWLPSVSIGSGSVVEGDLGASRVVSFPVTLSEPATVPLTVDYAIVADDSATAPEDVVVKSGTITFKLNNKGSTATKRFVSVKVKPDSIVEGDEQFHVILGNPTGGYSIAHGIGTGTILDDDEANPPTVDVAGASGLEGDAGSGNAVKAWITLSEPTSSTVTVDVAIHPSGATPNVDYRPIAKTITFRPGENRKAITMKIYADAVIEPDEHVMVELSVPTGGPALGRSSATLTILNDD